MIIISPLYQSHCHSWTSEGGQIAVVVLGLFSCSFYRKTNSLKANFRQCCRNNAWWWKFWNAKNNCQFTKWLWVGTGMWHQALHEDITCKLMWRRRKDRSLILNILYACWSTICNACTLGTCESFFCRSNRISNRIGRPIRFRIEYSNRIGRIPCKP